MDQLAELFNSLTQFIDSLSQLVTDSPTTYVVIFALAAFDVIFPLLPAEASVTAAAVLAGQGKLSIAGVVAAAGLGAFIGLHPGRQESQQGIVTVGAAARERFSTRESRWRPRRDRLPRQGCPQRRSRGC